MSKKIVFLYENGSALGLGHFYNKALSEKGHQAKIFYYNLDIFYKRLGRFSALFSFAANQVNIDLKPIIDFKPDLIIVMKGDFLNVSILEQLKKRTNAQLWNIYPDHPLVSLKNRAIQFRPALQLYDLIWSFSETLVPIFYQMGANKVRSIPFGYDPSVHFPVKNIDIAYDSDIAYLGTWGPLQEAWLQKLANFNLKIYGVGWDRSKKIPNITKAWMKSYGLGEDMKSAVSGSKLVFNMVRAEHCALHSMKTFELAACGGCVISNRTPEQEKFFTDGKDIIFFDNEEELLNKIKYYLEHEEERKMIVKNALETIKKHTYLNRIDMFLKELN